MAARILVINDTQYILEMFRMLLEDEGYEVILSSTPMQNMSSVEQLQPDLIILDLIFGSEKTGWQMLQMLKMYRATACIPVIVCTVAIEAVREMEGYLVSKSVLVVYKPFDVDELLNTITQALQSSTTSIPTTLETHKKGKRKDT
jgi:DNA-binding response OmpR family regulator